MTLPVVLPLVNAVGFDKLWFGIFLVVVVEMSQITPPVGFNLFVIQGLTGKPLGEIATITLPYLGVMVIFAALLARITSYNVCYTKLLRSMTVDGYETPITLSAALTISDAGIHVDYTGTSRRCAARARPCWLV